MIINDNYKKIFVGYLVCITLVLAGVFILFRKSRSNFEMTKFNSMVRDMGAWRDKTDDLCKYYIEGDPYVGSGNYVKLRIKCDDGRSISNTIDLSAINEKTVRGIINEYKRIVGYIGEVEDKNKWDCQIDGETITNFEIVPPKGASIDCNEK